MEMAKLVDRDVPARLGLPRASATSSAFALFGNASDVARAEWR
jgi:hypothetical protein